jgi:hypothetical protein
MTRCRVGDLAVIIADDHESQSNIGKFVHVMGKPNPEEYQLYGGEEWECASESWLMTKGDEGFMLAPPGDSIAFSDADLRPIRDPGDDAVDETIQRLGTPADKAMRELDEALAELKRVSRELRELEKQLT